MPVPVRRGPGGYGLIGETPQTASEVDDCLSLETPFTVISHEIVALGSELVSSTPATDWSSAAPVMVTVDV